MIKIKFSRLIPLFLICLTALVLLSNHASAEDEKAQSIMVKVDARDDGDNSVADMKMILIDKNNDKRVRTIKSFGKDKGEDTQRLMFFLDPAEVRDTAFLTYDYDDPDRDDDQWMYLPALKKTKRIASSDKSSPFMGSDFSYADMTKMAIENYHFKLIKEMDVEGRKTWVIESIPKTERVLRQYGYKKSILFVRQDIFMVIRAVHWLREGGRIKYMQIRKLEKIDGIWMGTDLLMKTTKNKRTLHSTVLKFNNVKFNQNLNEDMFTTRRLEKGL